MKKRRMENLYDGLVDEKKESLQREGVIAKFLEQNYKPTPKSRSPYARQSISMTQKEVEFVQEIRSKLAKSANIIPLKSEIYRMGLGALKNKSDQEIVKLFRELE